GSPAVESATDRSELNTGSRPTGTSSVVIATNVARPRASSPPAASRTSPGCQGTGSWPGAVMGPSWGRAPGSCETTRAPGRSAELAHEHLVEHRGDGGRRPAARVDPDARVGVGGQRPRGAEPPAPAVARRRRPEPVLAR